VKTTALEGGEGKKETIVRDRPLAFDSAKALEEKGKERVGVLVIAVHPLCQTGRKKKEKREACSARYSDALRWPEKGKKEGKGLGTARKSDRRTDKKGGEKGKGRGILATMYGFRPRNIRTFKGRKGLGERLRP